MSKNKTENNQFIENKFEKLIETEKQGQSPLELLMVSNDVF